MDKRCFLAAFALLLVVLAFAGMVGYRWLSGPQQEPQPWMRIGAYASYSGEIPGFSEPFILNATLVVLDLNSTHVKVATNSTIGNSFSPQPLTDRTVQWINKTNVNFQHRGETLADTYSAQIPVKGIGTRQCIFFAS
jgi:hypothetical protein